MVLRSRQMSVANSQEQYLAIMNSYKLKSIFLVFAKLLLFLLPVVDTFNGFLLRSGHFSVGIPYKILIIVVLSIYSILKGNRSVFILLLYMLSSFSLVFFYHSLKLYDRASVIFTDLGWFIKFYLFLSTLWFFLSSEKTDTKLLFKLSIWYFTVYSLNILLGFLGIGYSQYNDNIGGIGFIYAGNELSFALFSVSSIILIYLLHNRSFKYFYLFFFLSIAVSIMKATKTAFLSIFLFPIILLTLLFFQNCSISSLKVKKRPLLILLYHLLLSVIFLPLAVYILLFKVGLIERILFWLGKVDTLTLLLSNRNNFAADLLALISKKFSFWNYILGSGIPSLENLHTAEIDPIDILFSYGILGLLNIYGTLIYIAYKILKLKTDPELKSFVISSMLMGLIISSTAGHVVNSGLAAIPFAMLISMAFVRNTRISR